MSEVNTGAPSLEKDPSSGSRAAQRESHAGQLGDVRPDGAPGPEDSLMRHFVRNLWAANTVTVTVLAIALAMVIGAVLIIISDPNVLATYSYITARPADALNSSWAVVSDAYANLFKGAVVDPELVRGWINGENGWEPVFKPISETLTYTAPLVFTGLSVALAFRGGLFNIGAQGQATIGVILAALAGFLLPLPPVVHLIVALLAGALGGAIWGFIPGFLKARTGAHEVINTIMLNYVAVYFLAWIIVQKSSRIPTGPTRSAGRSTPRRSCPDCSATTCGCTPESCSRSWPPGRLPGCSTVPPSVSNCGPWGPTPMRPAPPESASPGPTS